MSKENTAVTKKKIKQLQRGRQFLTQPASLPDAGSVCCGISAVLGYHFIHQCAKRRIEW